MSQKLSGVSKDTAAGDIVSIIVPVDGPYGIILEPDRDGHAAVIKAFERMPDGKFGIIQKHGGVHYGDVLFQINDVQLDVVSTKDVMGMVRDRNLLKKSFKFCNATEYYRVKGSKAAPKIGGLSLNGTEKVNPFMSTIRQTRLSVDSAGKKFCEYEIASQFRVVSRRVQKEVVYRWSVWRRYNEFDKLHNALKKSLGWQMEGIELPPSNTFVFNKLATEFVEQRREDLNNYWQRIIAVNNGQVVEFQKHHAQPDIKFFLDVDKAMQGAPDVSPDIITEEAEGVASRRSSMVVKGGAAGASAASRRRSAGPGTLTRQSFAFGDSTPGAAPATTSRPNSGAFTPTAASTAPPAVTSVSSVPPPPAAKPSVPAPAPAPAADNISEELRKYKKMLDMKLPEGAVRNKMQSDGFSAGEIDKFMSAATGGGAPAPPSAARPPAPAAAPAAAPAKAPTPAAAPAAAPAAGPPSEGKLPPKATGARANLFADIAKRRID